MNRHGNERDPLTALQETARNDQYESFRRDYLAIDDDHQRYELVCQFMNRPLSPSKWRQLEAHRPELKRIEAADMTTGDITKLTGLTAAKIRRMADRGEMPAPAHVGPNFGWRFWIRDEIEQWWEERQSAHENG